MSTHFSLFDSRSIVGFGFFVLGAVTVTLLIELLVQLAVRDQPQTESPLELPPERVFAQSVVAYAASLGAAQRDDAVIELRAWATRFLHLGALLEERVALGEIALRSAMANSDRPTQASILMDDLGWTLHETGQSDKALNNVREAIGVLDRELLRSSSEQTKNLLTSLKVKAFRHQANITACTAADLTTARAAFTVPRQLAQGLPEPEQTLHQAQLDHSEAHTISDWLDRNLGNQGQVDSTGNNATILLEAVALAERAEQSFRQTNDKERELKALKLLGALLARNAARQPALEATARLNRLQQRVARNIHRSVK